MTLPFLQAAPWKRVVSRMTPRANAHCEAIRHERRRGRHSARSPRVTRRKMAKRRPRNSSQNFQSGESAYDENDASYLAADAAI